METYLYSVVRFVPDPVRGEQVNVGVVVASEATEFFASRFLPQNATGRLRRLSDVDDFRFIRGLANEMQLAQTPQLLADGEPRWSAGALRRAAAEWSNTIQFSAPRAALHERGEALLEALYARYVADPRPRRPRARDRRWIKRKVRTTLAHALVATRPEITVSEVLRRDLEVTGGIETHRFDYGLTNGQLRRLVHTLSLEGTDKTAIRNEVEAVAWAIDDVRKLDAVPISVVTIGGGQLLERAERLYGGLDASVIREPGIDEWANTVALDVAADH